MLRVSGPDLVVATCRAGAVGAFPTKNAATGEQLDAWLAEMRTRLADQPDAAPICPNLIIRDGRRDEDVRVLVKHQVEMVITSVGSPAPVTQPLHDAGCLVFADVATLEHARKAVDAGADGLILLTAGAGGQTGWMNPFAFVRAVRKIFDGPVVMAGGMSDGHALWAAQVLGCDLAYMGTKFIAACESMAADKYRDFLVASELDDIILTRNFTGLHSNMMLKSIIAAGIDPDKLDEAMDEERARREFGGQNAEGPRRWVDIWSAGHSVSGVSAVQSAQEIIDQTIQEYLAAQRETAVALAG